MGSIIAASAMTISCNFYMDDNKQNSIIFEVCNVAYSTHMDRAMEYNAGIFTKAYITLTWFQTLHGPAIISCEQARQLCMMNNSTILAVNTQSEFLRFAQADKDVPFNYRPLRTSNNTLQYKQFVFWHANVKSTVLNDNITPFCANVMKLRNILHSKYSRDGHTNVIPQILPEHVLDSNVEIFCNNEREHNVNVGSQEPMSSFLL